MFTNKTQISDDGRVCTKCLKFKLWKSYVNDYNNKKTHHSTKCKLCINKAKLDYRLRTNRAKDKEYKNKTRKLEVGQIISFLEPIYINWDPREDKQEVIDYKYNRWYTIKSLLTGETSRLDTNDNQSKNPNCKRFYKISNQC